MSSKIGFAFAIALFFSPAVFAENGNPCYSKWPKDICKQVMAAVEKRDLKRLALIQGLSALYLEQFILPGRLTEAEWKEFYELRGEIKNLPSDLKPAARTKPKRNKKPRPYPRKPSSPERDERLEDSKERTWQRFQCDYGVDIENNCP